MAKRVKLGTLREREDGELYFVLDQSINIQKGKWSRDDQKFGGFEDVSLNQYRSFYCNDATESLNRLKDAVNMDEEEFQKKLDDIQNKRVQFDVVATLDTPQ